jgi:hypothetical protein
VASARVVEVTWAPCFVEGGAPTVTLEKTEQTVAASPSNARHPSAAPKIGANVHAWPWDLLPSKQPISHVRGMARLPSRLPACQMGHSEVQPSASHPGGTIPGPSAIGRQRSR